MDAFSNRLIQNIVSCYKSQLPPMPLKQLKAVDAISGCRTGAYGLSAFECEQDRTENERLIAHSCRHRSCAVCGDRQRKEWIEKQKRRLLDVPHFHCVFTLPHEYHTLWRYNQKWFVNTFFDVVRSCLMDCLRDDKRHGITPGVLMAMHTWGRQLSLHPHIHCVVTAGGLDVQGRWKETGKFLLPGRQLRALYRGRFQDRIKTAFDAGELTLPPEHKALHFRRLHRETYAKTWCVRIEQRYDHGMGVLLYLSRYLRGGPIHPTQIERCESEGIGFRYKDHRDQRVKLLTLKPQEFIRRLLQHVPESGQHMIRHYGLYGGASRRKRNECRQQVGGLLENADTASVVGSHTLIAVTCRECGAPMRRKWTQAALPRKANSYRVEIRDGSVQQGDEPVMAEAKKTSLPLRL